MRNRPAIVYALLSALCIAFIVWQFAEHKRVVESSRQTLMSRGRAITGTLGLVIRSQRIRGGIISQERLEAALADLIKSGDVESIVLLNAEEKVVVAAGVPLPQNFEATPGVNWQPGRMLLSDLVDLGTNVFSRSESDRERRAIVVPEPTPSNRTNVVRREPGEDDERGSDRRRRRWFAFGPPPWMSREELEELSQQKGLHSFVIALPTRPIDLAASQDLWIRIFLGALAIGAAAGAGFAWRSFARSTDLEFRLIKASEMNLHLREMNLAAAGLAHETRNPLNIIRGLAQMISRRADASPEVRENSAAIVQESDRLTAQLNEFINYSRPREVRKAAIDLTRVATEVVRALTYDAEEKQIGITVNIPPLTIEADEQMLRQTLFNLLLNAIQAVGPGEQVSLTASRDANGEVVLDVSDTGPGVPPAQRLDIFKPYFTTHELGSGLGLAIVRQIVLAHGWAINYLPNEPRGAIFRITHIRSKG